MEVTVFDELMFSFGNKLDKLHGAITKPHFEKPVFRPLGTSATGAATLTVEQQNTVPAGRIYNLLQLNLFGADGHTALASAVADIYVASSGTELPDFSAQIFSGLAVPSMQTLSKEVIWIQPGERLVAMVYGFAAQASVTMVARVADYELHVKSADALR